LKDFGCQSVVTTVLYRYRLKFGLERGWLPD